jgi:hypothetical protein
MHDADRDDDLGRRPGDGETDPSLAEVDPEDAHGSRIGVRLRGCPSPERPSGSG